MAGLFIYAAVLLAVSLAAPREWWDTRSTHFLLILGLIASLRYTWAAIHLVRSIIYRYLVFPRMRREAEALGDAAMPPMVYLLLTSFRIDTETTREVYSAAIREAIAAGPQVMIVASIVEMADQRLIKHLFLALNPPERVRLSFVRIGGSGKRDALAQGLRAISSYNPTSSSVVAVVDGDSILTEGLLRRCLPFFAANPKVDAMTTDEVGDVRGRAIFRDWYNLRFAQRQVLMCSIGLSRRVLTLTGRMSAFRAQVAVDPEFIRMLEHDSISHWRLGRFKFLTGDDKSTWYYILRSGREMLYIPDVSVITIESPPNPSFVLSATALMRRWFGNMLRTNGRALALGPRRMGLFVWWSILDQRISMWTTLIGPFGALLSAVFAGPAILGVYLYWVALTRFVQTLALLTARSEVRWNYPFLLLFNQVFGSLIKTYVIFHLDKQRWTRQNTVAVRNLGNVSAKLIALTSDALHVVSILTFVVVVGLVAGLLNWPGGSDSLVWPF